MAENVMLIIPTESVARVRAMVENLGPQLIPDQLPEEIPEEWTDVQAFEVFKKMLLKFTRDLVKQVEASAAAEAARQAAITEIDTSDLIN